MNHKPGYYLDKELMERMYVRQRRSMKEISRSLGVGSARVRDSLIHHGTPIREPGGVPQRTHLPVGQVVKNYARGLSVEKIAAKWGVTEDHAAKVLKDSGVELRGAPKPSPHPRRRGVRWEQRVIGLSLTGKPIARTVIILECGHQSPVKSYALKKNATELVVPCKACGSRKDRS